MEVTSTPLTQKATSGPDPKQKSLSSLTHLLSPLLVFQRPTRDKLWVNKFIQCRSHFKKFLPLIQRGLKGYLDTIHIRHLKFYRQRLIYRRGEVITPSTVT
jgi:hypothetical protein